MEIPPGNSMLLSADIYTTYSLKDQSCDFCLPCLIKEIRDSHEEDVPFLFLLRKKTSVLDLAFIQSAMRLL